MAGTFSTFRPTDSVRGLFAAHRLAELARQALIAEAELTPKPGLVDRRGAGAHSDLSLRIMQQSASAIAPFFAAMGTAAQSMPFSGKLRNEVAAIGRVAENAMLQAADGSNTHKGAIWILGLLITAAAQGFDSSAEAIASDAGALARLPDHFQPEDVSHGDLVRVLYGAMGARGEAITGFPHVVHVAFPHCVGREVRATQKRIADCLRS